jgi:acylphosphatase
MSDQPKESTPLVRRRVIFVGRVQGVGFRATTASLARHRPVVGYVRNQADGSVELVVEGTAEACSQLEREIAAAFEGSIDDVHREVIPQDVPLRGFSVRG